MLLRTSWVLVVSLFAWSGCEQSACAPGKSGCACIQSVCDEGLVCVETKCRGEARADLTISDSKARACEVLLRETGGKIARIVFETSTTGRWLRQGDKISAAFHANSDGPIGGGAVKVAYAGASAPATFDVVRSHCYGARGEELAGATVRR